jgi:acyl-CoA dehydrogenase
MRRTLWQPEHEEFRATVREFIETQVVPHTEQWAEAGIIPAALFRAAGAAGLLSTAIPEQYGGRGKPDFRFNLILNEELARVGAAAVALGITLHTDIDTPYFLRLANDEQKSRWLPGSPPAN